MNNFKIGDKVIGKYSNEKCVIVNGPFPGILKWEIKYPDGTSGKVYESSIEKVAG